MKKKKILKIIAIIMGVIAVLIIGLGYAWQEKFGYSLISTVADNTYTSKQSQIVSSYQEYENLVTSNDSLQNIALTENSFVANDYLIIFQRYECDVNLKLSSVDIKKNKFAANFDVEKFCGGPLSEEPENLVFAYPIEKGKYTNVTVTTKYKVVNDEYCDPNVVWKPILYLYPEEKTEITVKLKDKENIITSYPKYIDSWNVIAHPNGDLYDKDNKYYYALYWDEKTTFTPSFDEGFYVTKDNAITFLEEKLSIIGLNDKERNEFIMYWLPILEKNERNLIYFELTDERQKHNELIITPTPDSLLRINMHIKKVNKKINIKEQELPTFERKGFTAVEWGGTRH